MFRGAVANRAGISQRTASSTIGVLADSGNLNRDIETRGGGADPIEKELFLSLPKHVLLHPSSIVISEDDEHKWGGWRVKTCRNCGSSNLQEYHHYVCKDCGQDHQPDQTIDLLESTLEAEKAMADYPQAQSEAMAADDILPPQRACFHCGKQEWFPAHMGDNRWGYACGSYECHPFLITSRGLDLSMGSALRKDSTQ
jgi:hypothetical protein